MSIRIGAALSHSHDARSGGDRGGAGGRRRARGRARRTSPSCSPAATISRPRRRSWRASTRRCGPRALVGCGASGVLAAGAEVESGTAVAVWAAALRRRRRAHLPRQLAAARRATSSSTRSCRRRAGAGRRDRRDRRCPTPTRSTPTRCWSTLREHEHGACRCWAARRARGPSTAAPRSSATSSCSRRARSGWCSRACAMRAVRVAGRGAAGPGADDHARRGPRDPRARRQAGAGQAARGLRRARASASAS